MPSPTGFEAVLLAWPSSCFSVQSVVSRLVLPKLGGSLAVLNTCVCFFQAALPPVHGTRT
ncbi:MAG: hypothetical protein ICV73_24965 [Acetobacteraceae bacterium]|nr:hypothetical protein [Acetobacteraceae bacterium]